MPLKDYKTKRDFTRTKEPSGKAKKGKTMQPIFVVQKHQATRLHYDFRLEIDGVLKSWAVPKGPSMNPADKRLAVMVEDHPYDYRDFEGTIPEGEYGAGTVMIWDQGTFEMQEGDAADALERGALKIRLNGKKLRGGFALVRTAMGGKKENWLLIKEKDEFAQAKSNILEDEPDSAASGRTMDEISREEG
ncbi:MAG TPA: DNA polymerase ligase N-terminal domain-containing protein [Planctomycetota bacterium]|nr:DNA polymerase ligase N-terminal domain-containing protein [Planctomycetota bacterium]